MRISVNLATRPFVELRPLFARLRLAVAALALLAIGLGFALHHLNMITRVQAEQMRQLKEQTAAVENERRANEARMMEPQNRAVLDRSKFLNALFESKSFSWTSVMMDLETVLPAGVQVTSIEPGITPDGGVNIHLRVSGPRELQVDLVRNLERSQRFLAPHVSNETAQTEEQGRLVQTGAGVPGGVQFDIVSGYNPLPAAEKAKKSVSEGGSH
jgi:type IV pilus assembly protein PilN